MATICTPVQRPGGERRGIVFVHGLGSDRRGYVEYGEQVAAGLGIWCLAVDLSGHGASTGDAGEISPAQHLRDVLAAWDELTRRCRPDARRIGLCGSSYGACLAALAVQHRRAARLLLRAPTIVTDEDLARPLRLRSPDRDPVAASVLFGGLSRFRSPALVVECENDEVIPHALVGAYLAALPTARHAVLTGAAHALTAPEWREDFARQMLAFFADL